MEMSLIVIDGNKYIILEMFKFIFHADLFIFMKGVLIPNSISDIKSLKSNSKFTLIVEKDATFQRLIDDNFTTKFSAILITVFKNF